MAKSIQLIQTSPEELKQLILEGFISHIDELREHFQPKEPEEYLTRQEVADILKVDISTIHNWSKQEKLIPYGIGSRVLFKRSEVEAQIIPLNRSNKR